MTLRNFAAWLAVAPMLAACGQAADGTREGGNMPATAAENAIGPADRATADLRACPFRRTRAWVGSVEYGHVRINGNVDLQMAGFRPALTERDGAAGGALALDLALQPAPGEPITDHVRYERRAAPAYRRAEIWCGGERIAQFDMTVVQ